MNHSYSVIFFLKKDSRLTINEGRVFFRITVNGKRVEQSIKRSISPDRWDSKAGRAYGKRADAKAINEIIVSVKARLNKIHSNLSDRQENITSKSIRDIFNGLDQKQKSLVEVFEFHNAQMKAQIGKEFSASTYKRYETTLAHIKCFMTKEYKREDMLLSELKYKFVTDFEFYMKTVRKCNHNSALKYIRYFRKIINIAVKNEWLDRDPFQKYQVKLKETNRGHLSKEELQRLETKEINMPRLSQVRDAFVFCCYTGLSFVDIEKLTPKDVSKGMDGEYWIFTQRTKTKSNSNIPLLPKAIEIIEKYQDNPKNLNEGKLLPVLTNQRMNAYLKELATICEIDKNITFHMARHTFATTVTLSNGVSIETVSSMLGHKNIRTTQIYAKVVQEKVSEDMMALKQKLNALELKKAANQ